MKIDLRQVGGHLTGGYRELTVAAVVLGVAVCVAIGQGADMMQDLKTGFMLGAKPIKQQIVQFAFTWLGVFVALGAVYALWTNGPGGEGGFGNKTALPAPQGGALMAVIEAIKTGNVPVDKYVMGGTIGPLLGAAPMPGLGVLIGLAMYLPFPITFGYGIGCLIHVGLRRAKGPAFCEHKLVPLAAGLIVGGRYTLIEHYGMKEGAEIMLQLSLAERNFNRVWSAAADSCLPEAHASLAKARAALEDVVELVEP